MASYNCVETDVKSAWKKREKLRLVLRYKLEFSFSSLQARCQEVIQTELAIDNNQLKKITRIQRNEATASSHCLKTIIVKRKQYFLAATYLCLVLLCDQNSFGRSKMVLV